MNILKLSGSLIVIITSVIIGMVLGERQKEYIKVLQSLKRCLIMIRGEISYSCSPLKEIFTKIAELKLEYWSDFFGKVLEEMNEVSNENKRKDLYEIWDRICNISGVLSYMSNDDRKELIRFGQTLGSTDKESQINSIELYVENITQKTEYLQRNVYGKVKLCHALGAAAGIFIIILLI